MVTRLNRFSAGVYALVVAAAVWLGAFPAAAADKATLRLDWINSGYHAIWYYGLDKGIFQKAGIDLEVLEGKGSAVTAQTVGNGSVMFGTADTAVVMGFISQGMPIKMVGGYLRQSALAIVFPAEKGWKRFKDIGNATIGYSAGGASSQILPALMKNAGLEGKVQLVSMEPAAKMTAILTHRVDGVELLWLPGGVNPRGPGLQSRNVVLCERGREHPWPVAHRQRRHDQEGSGPGTQNGDGDGSDNCSRA